jgi:chemotaxis protein histidine kinase CheA
MLEKMAQDILDQLEKDIKEELKNKLEQGKKAQQEKEKELKENLRELEEQAKNLEKEVQDLEKQEQKTQGKEKERLEKELQEKKKQIEENQKRKEKISKDLENLKEQKEKGQQPIPMDQISEKLKEKLKEFFDQLPENKKQEFEEKAKENLEDLEDTLNEKMEPKLNEDNPESHQERKEREKKEEEETIKKRGEEKAVEEARIKAREKMEKEQTVYQKYYKKVKPLIDDLYKRLLKIFIPQRHPRWEKGYPSGGRLDLLKAMQFEADKTKYQELWERKTIPRKIDYRFSLLVDLSGSMEGEKIKETFKGVIVLAEVLNHLGIKFNILGFQDIPISFKDFRENLDRSKRNLLSGMLKEVKNENPGGNNRAEYNSDGFCLQETAKELEKNKGKDNFLIVLSDGLPVPDKAHSGEEYELSHIISQIKKRKIIKLIGLGLGPETEHVKDYYPVSLPNIKVEDLPKTLAQLLEDMIRNPQKY